MHIHSQFHVEVGVVGVGGIPISVIFLRPQIIRTHSLVDVVWQDGSIEKGIPSTQLYPIHHGKCLSEMSNLTGLLTTTSQRTINTVTHIISVSHLLSYSLPFSLPSLQLTSRTTSLETFA